MTLQSDVSLDGPPGDSEETEPDEAEGGTGPGGLDAFDEANAAYLKDCEQCASWKAVSRSRAIRHLGAIYFQSHNLCNAKNNLDMYVRFPIQCVTDVIMSVMDGIMAGCVAGGYYHSKMLKC